MRDKVGPHAKTKIRLGRLISTDTAIRRKTIFHFTENAEFDNQKGSRSWTHIDCSVVNFKCIHGNLIGRRRWEQEEDVVELWPHLNGPLGAQKSQVLLLLLLLFLCLCLSVGVQMGRVGWAREEDDCETKREAPNPPSRVGVAAISSARPAHR